MPRIEIGQGVIAYQDEGPLAAGPGQGEPLLLLHGSASAGAQWRALRASAVGRHRCLTPDLFGYGESSDWPAGRPYSLESEAAVARAMMALAGRPLHLIGHSYGGAVALRAALARPDRVLSLTLIEPVAFHLLSEADARGSLLLDEIRRLAADVAQALARSDRDAALARFVDYWSGPGAWSRLEPQRQARLRASAPKLNLDFRAVLSEPATLGEVMGLALPCQLVCGSESPEPVQRIVELLGAALPHAAVSRVAGAGHLLPVTHATLVNGLILDHVREFGCLGRLAA